MRQDIITEYLNEVFDKDKTYAQERLDFISNPKNRAIVGRMLAEHDATAESHTDNDPTFMRKPLKDGVYYIYADGTKKRYEGQDPVLSWKVKYIGVVMGDRRIAIALHDAPGGDDDGEMPLLPDMDKCPNTSEHYSYDREADRPRFNAMSDFGGMGSYSGSKTAGTCRVRPVAALA